MKKIWIDCDPGIDDAMMLAMVKASEDKLKVIGISSVAGNQYSDIVTNNALKLASLLNIEAPVVRGAREPLIQPMKPCPEVHGPTGLGYTILPETEKEVASEHGISFMYQTIMEQEERVTIVPTGPLTNIALLLKLYPEVKDHIEELVIMGGASVIGNASATAEFNIYTDPEAAKIVFSSNLNITVCSLDITNYCGIDGENIEKLKNSSNRTQHLCGEIMEFAYNQNEARINGLLSLHDVCTIIYLTNPEVYKGIRIIVDVDCNEGINRGATICDKREYRNLQQCNVNWLTDVNQEAWLNVVLRNFWTI
ncbi:MAG: nucleoside hydrolase [Bacillota bacterium]|nr:nucleoside hydrolase [Bacillota bacterium]